jgi:hypothetical protein
MIVKRVIKGSDVFAADHEIHVPNDGGQLVGGNFGGTFTIDEPPGYFVPGQWVRLDNGKTQLFASGDAAREAAFAKANELLP